MSSVSGSRSGLPSNGKDNSKSDASSERANTGSFGQTTAENLITSRTATEALFSEPSTTDILSGRHYHTGSEAFEAAPFSGSAFTFTSLANLGIPSQFLGRDFTRAQTDGELASEDDASTGVDQLNEAYNSYQVDGDTDKFKQSVSTASVKARQDFVNQLAPNSTDQVEQGVNPQAHAINVVLQTLPEADFVTSIEGLSQPQRDAVLSDFVDVSVQKTSRGSRQTRSPGGLIEKIGEISDPGTRAALFSQQLTQLNTQPEHATAAARVIVNQLDAPTFDLLSQPGIEALALSVADGSSGLITDALVRLGGDAPSVNLQSVCSYRINPHG